MKILAISGSTRRDSTNTALLKGIKALAPDDFELTVFDSLWALPIFSPDLEGDETPVAVRQFMACVSACDGLIISSPEYVRSFPGALKNAIDWMVSRFEIIDKPIALVHASHRGNDMLGSLRLVLSTVSKQFVEHPFLRIPLIGKSTDEIEQLIHTPELESRIVSFLNDYASAVHQSGSHT